MRVYFDACTVIYYVERNAELFPRIDERINDPRTRVVVSELCRLECRVQPLRRGNATLLERYDAFFASPDLLWVPAGRKVFDRATELRARHGLKTPDALHLAAAIEAGCDELMTSDRRLDAAAGTDLRTLVL